MMNLAEAYKRDEKCGEEIERLQYELGKMQI